MCVYILPPWRLLPSGRCPRHTWGHGSTILCCEYWSGFFRQVPSSRYLKMSYFTSKDEISSHTQNWTENDTIYWRPTKRYWYGIFVGLNSKPTIDEKILKIRRLLQSNFFYFESSPWHQHKDLFVLVERNFVAPTRSPCWHTGRNLLVRKSPSRRQGVFHREGAGCVLQGHYNKPYHRHFPEKRRNQLFFVTSSFKLKSQFTWKITWKSDVKPRERDDSSHFCIEWSSIINIY